MGFLSQLTQFAVDTSTEIKISAQDVGLTPRGALGGGDIANVLNAVYFIAGIVAVVAIIIGGIRYTTSNGDANKVKSGKETVTYAVVGLVIVIMAAAITAFVAGRIKV